VYQKCTSRVKKIIPALKAKQLERDFLRRLLGGLQNGTKPAPLETKGCGTLKSKADRKARPPARRNVFPTSNDLCSNSATLSGKTIRKRAVCSYVSRMDLVIDSREPKLKTRPQKPRTGHPPHNSEPGPPVDLLSESISATPLGLAAYPALDHGWERLAICKSCEVDIVRHYFLIVLLRLEG
jgi:hypothetical protein